MSYGFDAWLYVDPMKGSLLTSIVKLPSFISVVERVTQFTCDDGHEEVKWVNKIIQSPCWYCGSNAAALAAARYYGMLEPVSGGREG